GEVVLAPTIWTRASPPEIRSARFESTRIEIDEAADAGPATARTATTAISRRPMRIDPSTCPLQRKRKRLLPASGAGGFGLARDLFGRAERLQHVRAPRPGSSRESRARTGRRRRESRKSIVPQRNRAHTRELAVPIETGAARPHNPLVPG